MNKPINTMNGLELRQACDDLLDALTSLLDAFPTSCEDHRANEAAVYAQKLVARITGGCNVGPKKGQS